MLVETIRRVLRSPDLRLMAVATVGTLVMTAVDGTFFRSVISPTIGYRWAPVFWLTLVAGWRGLLWSGPPTLAVFVAFFAWRGAAMAEPLYLLSAGAAVVVARKIARSEPWLSSERATLAFLAGAIVAPVLPAMFSVWVLHMLGRVPTTNPVTLTSWLRETAGILAMTPVLLVHCSNRLRGWMGQPAVGPPMRPVGLSDVVELGIESVLWTAALWASVHFRAQYHLNVSYLAFLPPLAITLRHGMRLSTIALAVNTLIATTLWSVLHWEQALSLGDLRLLIPIYSIAILVLAAVVDERRRASKELESAVTALRDSEEKFATAFYNAPLSLFLSRPDDGTILETNNTLLERTGYSREEVLGRTTIELGLVTAETRARLIKEVIKKGRITGREATLGTKSGELLPCLYNGALVMIGGERRLLSIVEDIGDRKRTEEKNIELQRHLQQAQKMETLGRLAAGIAHDFNNLLTVINGYSGILWNKLAEQPELQKRVDEIRKAGVTAATLTEQLLAFSQRRKIPAETLDLNAIVLTSEGMLARLLGEDVSLETDLDCGLHAIMATSGGIQQILMNLAANARDAMPHGGKVIVGTRSTTALDPEDPTAAAMRCAMLSVRDTGQGIAPEHIGRLFEPFFTTKELRNNTGMGLATVYGLVKQSGGWIAVDSQVGHGATFFIYFPAALDARVSSREPERHPAPVRSGATILLAEDQPEIRSFACEVLQSSGYNVIEAGDSVQALERSLGFPGRIDLLVSDVIMPNMRGTELAARIRARRSGLPVLFMSGYAPEVVNHTDDSETILLAKPFSPEQLVSAVERALLGVR